MQEAIALSRGLLVRRPWLPSCAAIIDSCIRHRRLSVQAPKGPPRRGGADTMYVAKGQTFFCVFELSIGNQGVHVVQDTSLMHGNAFKWFGTSAEAVRATYGPWTF